MADVAGHGTPAAVIMTVMPTLIHAELPSNRDKWAGEFLEHVNGVMSETYLRDRRFVTVWAAVLDPVSRRLTYASAGHNPPRLLRGGSVLALDVAGGVPLGIDAAATDEDVGITLEPEDLLVMYTDGITEAMRRGIDGLELFGTKRLDRVLCECGSDRASDDTERVRKAIAAFTNYAAPTDDQTMLILRARSTSPWSQNGTYYRPDETLRRDSGRLIPPIRPSRRCFPPAQHFLDSDVSAQRRGRVLDREGRCARRQSCRRNPNATEHF